MRRRALWLCLFLAIGAFYGVTSSFRNITDTDLNSLQTRALALHGDVDLTRYRDTLPRPSKSIAREDHIYSAYGVGVSLGAVPIYAVAARAGASDRVLQALASIPFVAAGVLILLRLFLRMFPRRIATSAAVVYAFGTTMWPVAAMGFFQTGPASLCQAIGLTGFLTRGPRAPVLAGLGFGFAALVRPTLLIPLAIVGVVYLIEDRRSAFLYAAGALPAIAGVVIQNRWIWGSWLTGGYSEVGVGFRGDIPHALNGLLFGWWRGIFVYSPVLILGVAGGILALRRVTGSVERRLVALAASTGAIVFLYARWSVWYGGTSQFGYRLLLDVVPFLVVLGAYAVNRSPRLSAVGKPLAAVSILVMAVGAAPNIYGWETGAIDPRGIEQTSLGQSWIEFGHRPLGTILRLAGVAVVAFLLYRLAPAPPTAEPALPADGSEPGKVALA